MGRKYVGVATAGCYEVTVRAVEESMMKDKKVWRTPEIVTYGTVEGLTQQTNKDFGGVDGLTFQQQNVQWTS